MKMIEVKSSNITHIGHSGATLTVAYKSGGIYTFSPVSGTMFQLILNAPSVGKAVNALGVKGVKL